MRLAFSDVLKSRTGPEMVTVAETVNLCFVAFLFWYCVLMLRLFVFVYFVTVINEFTDQASIFRFVHSLNSISFVFRPSLQRN